MDSKGNYELEAIVGDARRRSAIKGIRLYLESHIEGFLCWHRNVDLEYMYLHRPGRKPSRQFNYDIILVGPPPHDADLELRPEFASDECFHPRLAVALSVRIMCNESVPMDNAHVLLVVNRTSDGPVAIDVAVTADTGVYEGPAFLGADTRLNEVQNMILVFTNACGDSNRLSNFTACTRIPLDYVYAYEEEFVARKFIFVDQVDTSNHTCEGMEDVLGEN
ncbi:hypothetical protein AAVH_13355 [Aphelenchoides avenae]|nr:hypothetical protein AAVH_13355 [Aphelenchus avenae]